MSDDSPDSTDPAKDFGIDTSVRLAVFDSLAVDPSVAVSLMRDDGKILWGNDQAARLWVGDRATTSDFIGKNIHDLQPKEWNSTRQEVFDRVRGEGKPVVLRLMWKGKQYFSLFRLIKGSPVDHDRFLIVTRHVPSGDPSDDLIDSSFDLVEASAVGLGHLDVLTPRELEVLALVGRGLSTREISQALSRSEKPLRTIATQSAKSSKRAARYAWPRSRGRRVSPSRTRNANE